MRKILFLLLTLITIVKGQESPVSDRKDMLMGAGSISVTIGGAFVANGTYPASQYERVDQFITRIYTAAKGANVSTPNVPVTDTRLIELATQAESFARRNIVLQRFSGEKIIIDLEKFRLTGDFTHNPYLKNNDVLIFPKLDLERNFISTNGAVNSPTKFQFVEGDRLSDAILLSGGINTAYKDVKKAEISRLSYNGQKEELLNVDISANPPLQVGDRVRIVADETQKRDFRVYVGGEVLSPGYIPVTKGGTTLREVILKAGGFRRSADLNRAELIRGANIFKSLVFNEEFEGLMMKRMSTITEEDSSSFVIDNKLRFFRGNGIVDFTNVMSDTSAAAAFIVRDGDYINIPEKADLVYVFGQVNTPGYVHFEKGKDYSYYLQQAGGMGETAEGTVYVIKGKTRAGIEAEKDKNLTIEPGDFIWMPKQIHRTFSYYLTRVGAVAGVIGTLATLVILLLQINK
ncbi:MAG: SLBB domain-containing protein [Methanococcaceae archaeon]